MFIDTHSHIDGPEFADDLEDVLARAREAGVEKILVPAINAEGMQRLITVCQEHSDYLVPMIGLHPEEVKDDYQQQLDQLHSMLLESNRAGTTLPKFCAIGEVGLDFYWDDTFRSQQLDAFEQQITWAATYDLPLMIHARNAHKELVEAMERHRSDNLRGVFHCFSGTADEARQLLSFPRFMLGIGGVLTFKKSTLPDVLREAVPLDRIVLETDAPYLAPVPYRGKRNESAFIAATAARLNEIYACETTNIAIQTKKNANICIL